MVRALVLERQPVRHLPRLPTIGLDDLARVTRLRIVPKLALELRVVAALERLYDLELSERLARLRRKLEMRAAGAPAGMRREPLPAAG